MGDGPDKQEWDRSGRRRPIAFVTALVIAAALFVAADAWAQTAPSPFEALFGARLPSRPMPPAAAAPRREIVRHHLRLVHARPARARRPAPRQAYCVRVCDGYFFPLGTPYRRNAGATQEAACAAACPGAETALYVGARTGDGIAAATAARDGRRYSALPTALVYTHAVGRSCSCGAPGGTGGDLMAVLRDMTLRRGDAVMTAAGFRVFGGDKDSQHGPDDFRSLARSRDIGPHLRGTLHALEVASLAAVPRETFVALDAPPQRTSALPLPGFHAVN